jgi:hypothetical protein
VKWSCCGQSCSSVLGFGFQLDFVARTHTQLTVHVGLLNSELRKIRLAPDLLVHNYCVRRGGFACHFCGLLQSLAQKVFGKGRDTYLRLSSTIHMQLKKCSSTKNDHSTHGYHTVSEQKVFEHFPSYTDFDHACYFKMAMPSVPTHTRQPHTNKRNCST